MDFVIFGVKLPSRAGMKKVPEAAYQARRDDHLMHARVKALLEAVASVEAQSGRLDDRLKELSRRDEIA
jgi:hypothetical protein